MFDNLMTDLIKYSHKLKLLYVEDNIEAREMTKIILDDFFNNIEVAVDGEDGLKQFKENEFDLIITDINMPKLNGLDMIEKIRDIDKNIPILILSAYNEEDLFMRSIKLGIDGYILKPIDLEQLMSAFQRVIQKYKYKLESKNNLHLLEEYQKATNESSIVSKTDIRGIITYVNDNFCRLSDYKREELIGKNHNIIRHPDNPKEIFANMWDTIKNKKQIWKGIVRNKTKYGKSYYVDSVVIPILDIYGNTIEYISLRNEITTLMNPNKQLTDAVKNSTNLILIYFKLDKFNEIEEFYDSDTIEMLKNKAYKYLYNILSNIYKFDILYHLENGEYALILDKNEYLKDENSFIQGLKECQRLIKNNRIYLEHMAYDISVLISVAYENNKILKSVKLGLKKILKNNEYFIISNNLADIQENKSKENMKIIMTIETALKNSKIISYFQPIIDNKTEEIVKYESLVRLIDEDDKVLTPFFFLDISKKSDQYLKITHIVLEHSFKMLKQMSADISINLSALDIEEKYTRAKVLELLEENKEDASRIVFELLEDEGIKNLNTVKEFITDVKKYGVKIAIDDFGAGYSNYERLLEYQPDILKIDGCLIRDIATNNYSLSVVKSIVTFSKEQNLQTIAEFIENEEIFNIVKTLGVDFSQGYYFSKPIDLIGNQIKKRESE
jgi:PAS domain S-box-containing protein